MNENNQPEVQFNENPNGTVSFATEVIATIAGLAANEVEGVASMSSQGGFSDMFTRKSQRNLTKGVKIDLVDNKVTAQISVVVEYGTPVPELAANLQENVKKAIETMTGLEVNAVNIMVTGISFEREQRAAAELEEQRRSMLEAGEAEEENESEGNAAPEAEAEPEEEAEEMPFEEEDREEED